MRYSYSLPNAALACMFAFSIDCIKSCEALPTAEGAVGMKIVEHLPPELHNNTLSAAVLGADLSGLKSELRARASESNQARLLTQSPLMCRNTGSSAPDQSQS